jgi:hypothetical protein
VAIDPMKHEWVKTDFKRPGGDAVVCCANCGVYASNYDMNDLDHYSRVMKLDFCDDYVMDKDLLYDTCEEQIIHDIMLK